MSLTLYTIGFAGWEAEGFFETLKAHKIRFLIDVRLNNTSQLAGFTKRDDLAYFLKAICKADYRHEPQLAPTKEILVAYKKKKITWEQYEVAFLNLLEERKVERIVKKRSLQKNTVFLCSEPTPERCHRRLVVEYLAGKSEERIDVAHLVHPRGRRLPSRPPD